jgi:hypothetical protein
VSNLGVNLRSRLLCPECDEVKPVRAIDESIVLACGHSRPECLPAAPGHLSLEDLWTKLGRELFPASLAYEPPGEPEPHDDDISVLPVSSDDALTVCLEVFEEYNDATQYEHFD